MNFSALSANPDEVCNVYVISDYNFVLIFSDLFLCMVTLIYYAFKTNNENSNMPSFAQIMEMQSINDGPNHNVSEDANENDIINESKQQDSAYFHVLMICYSITIGMILTNWGLVSSFS